jgi:hypothetical protein
MNYQATGRRVESASARLETVCSPQTAILALGSYAYGQRERIKPALALARQERKAGRRHDPDWYEYSNGFVAERYESGMIDGDYRITYKCAICGRLKDEADA